MIHEISNPIIKNKLAQLRNKITASKDFRELVEEISMLLTYEVAKNFETQTVDIETPIKSCRVEVLNENNFVVVPILRAGLAMAGGALKMLPNSSVGHVGLYCNQQQYEQAIKDYDKVIELNPNDANAYLNRGNAYGNLGQYDQAIKNYDKAIELNPNDANAYVGRSNAYYHLGQKERAIQDSNKVIELDPNNDMAYNNRGWGYFELGQYDQAIQYFDKALELNPDNEEAKTNREECLKEIGK